MQARRSVRAKSRGGLCCSCGSSACRHPARPAEARRCGDRRDKGGAAQRELVVARSDTTKALEAARATPDQIATLIALAIQTTLAQLMVQLPRFCRRLSALVTIGYPQATRGASSASEDAVLWLAACSCRIECRLPNSIRELLLMFEWRRVGSYHLLKKLTVAMRAQPCMALSKQSPSLRAYLDFFL